MTNKFPQALTIAGSDSDGSAGIEADLHSFFQQKVYGTVILTAAVAGNSYGIFDSFTLPKDFIKQEFKNLGADFKIRASKTGMLASTDLISLVAQEYQKYDFGPLVVDPVIVTKHGAFLVEKDGIEAFKKLLFPLATVVTPNFHEAEALTGLTLNSDQMVKQAAVQLQKLGAKNIIIKGSHNFDSSQKTVKDFVLLMDGDSFWLENDYINTQRINGTGDTLSAIITAQLALGKTVKDAIIIANEQTHQALEASIDVGHKYGPINHWKISDN